MYVSFSVKNDFRLDDDSNFFLFVYIENKKAKSYEQNLDARVKNVTKNLHTELKIYEENRAQDFFSAVKEYVKKQILFEKQQLNEWENLRPDIKAITKRNMHIYAFGDEKLDAKSVAEKLNN